METALHGQDMRIEAASLHYADQWHSDNTLIGTVETHSLLSHYNVCA